MRRLLTAAMALCVSAAGFGATSSAGDPGRREPRPGVAYHHFILTPQRVLNDDEQNDLARRGLFIESAVIGGRYLVAMAPDSTVDDSDPRVAQLEPLTAEKRLHRSAIREVAKAMPAAHLNVQFHDDVTFADAKRAVEAAGGSLEDPLQSEFGPVRRMPVVMSPGAVQSLASDERVLFVFGPVRLKMTPNNLTSAALSNITPLYAGPYDLSGQGVTLGYFELGQADASHPEFGGRLTTHISGGATDDQKHATHVGGTMIASGIDSSAKGMAPAATLEEFDAAKYPDSLPDLRSYNIVAVNNSWGYVLGWKCADSSCSSWVWTDTDAYYGAYDTQVTAPLDKLTRSTGVLWVHSAGNDARKTGPTDQWYTHQHEDSSGSVISGKTYCYSADGTGNDCPQPTCTAGRTYCEVVRHPRITTELPDPWMSIGVTASAKDVIAVGAVSGSPGSTPLIASFSSRGPTRDGRVKPDVVTLGVSVYSTLLNNTYGNLNGTSMAAPVVTGTAALLTEQWRRTFGGANPTPAALKTLMIATAVDVGNPGPDFTYGFGLLNAKAAIDTLVADGAQARRIRTDASVRAGDVVQVPVSLSAPQDLRVVLGWSDPEVVLFGDDGLAAQTLVNDLDLKVIAPDGSEVLPYVLDKVNPAAPATHGVNTVDNTEEVEIKAAPAGSYKIVVTGRSVTAQSPQSFVLVSNGEMAALAVPCTDPYQLYGSPSAAYGNLASGQSVSGRTCGTSDSDYFKFLVDKAGTVSITVTTTDTPVRATLSSDATSPVTVDVPAESSRTLTTQFAGGSTTFYVGIQAEGTVGPTGKYTLTTSFPYAQHARRRSVRRK